MRERLGRTSVPMDLQMASAPHCTLKWRRPPTWPASSDPSPCQAVSFTAPSSARSVAGQTALSTQRTLTDKSDYVRLFSPARVAMTILQINDQEVIYFDPHRCPRPHCITKKKQKTSDLYVCVCLFFLSLWLVVFKWNNMCPWLLWRFGGGGPVLTWLQVFFTVYCTCQFRCLYFTKFKLQFCEAVEQIATVKLLSPVRFCTVKLSVSI